jgi:hypothetical protein
MTGEDLLRAGYSKALWIAAPGAWWLRPDGNSICSEEEALREIGELVASDEEDRER